MYKPEYVCDCCKKIMDKPVFILNLSSRCDASTQDQYTWHYCEECWPKVKEMLNGKSDFEELKKENEKLKKDASWYEQFFTSICMAFLKSYYKNTGYGFTTTTTASKESNGPFSVGCCCENTNL